MAVKKKCRTKGCKCNALCRWLCKKCYAAAMRMFAAAAADPDNPDLVSEDDAIRLRLIGPRPTVSAWVAEATTRKDSHAGATSKTK